MVGNVQLKDRYQKYSKQVNSVADVLGKRRPDGNLGWTCQLTCLRTLLPS